LISAKTNNFEYFIEFNTSLSKLSYFAQKHYNFLSHLVILNKVKITTIIQSETKTAPLVNFALSLFHFIAITTITSKFQVFIIIIMPIILVYSITIINSELFIIKMIEAVILKNRVTFPMKYFP